jgi:hypothetical protein
MLASPLSTRLSDGMRMNAMSAEDLVKEIFLLDEDIRWVGVVDQVGKILQNIQRPGVESLVDLETEERTLLEFPTIMGLFWRELVGRSGKLDSLLVGYSRVYMLAFYVGELLVVLSFEPRGMPRVIRRLEAKYGSLIPSASNQDVSST